MIQTRCPECGKPIEVPDSQAGKVEICIHCSKDIQIPKQGLANLVPIKSSKVIITSKTKRWIWVFFGWLLIAIGVFGIFVQVSAHNNHSHKWRETAYLHRPGDGTSSSRNDGWFGPDTRTAIGRIYSENISYKMQVQYEMLTILFTIITGISILHRESILSRQIKEERK
jgi:hypothetical protein